MTVFDTFGQRRHMASDSLKDILRARIIEPRTQSGSRAYRVRRCFLGLQAQPNDDRKV